MINYTEMDQMQKIDYLSDILADATCEIRYTAYQNLNDNEKNQVKIRFHHMLENENIVLTHDIIEQAEKTFPSSPLASLLRQYGYVRLEKSKFDPAAEQLTKGRKVTIIKFSEFGFPVLINTIIERTEIKPYAQYKDSLKIVHKPKRKRSLYANTILPYQELLVYDGWLDLDLRQLTHETIGENEHMKMEQTKYCSFDDNFIKDIRSYIKQEPIVEIQKAI